MEELVELRSYIETGRYAEALTLLGEMEEMSYDDKVNKIGSFVEILLLHLIKQSAEGRTTRSWDISIRNALDGMGDVNRRRRSSGFYLDEVALQEVIADHYDRALRLASLEAFGGRYEPEQLADMFSDTVVRKTALEMILTTQDKKR
jgi:hypothetical protein